MVFTTFGYIGNSGRLDQAIPCALEHRVVLLISKIVIDTDDVNMVKVFWNCVFSVLE